MVLTSYISISGPSEDLFYSNLQSGDRLTLGKIRIKKTLFSRRTLKGITARSLLPQVSAMWNALTIQEQQDWSDAGSECGLNGFRLFVKDTTARIKNGLSGSATPSLLHQCWVGELKISAPATELKIEQIHPNAYWVNRKVPKKKGMYEPVQVIENFNLPLQLSINYKSDLVACGSNPKAVYYAEIWHSYQGNDIFTNLELPLDFSSDWKNDVASISSVIGQTIGYTLYIYLYNVRGTLFVDNIKAIHDSQNWVRDTYCNNIRQTFTKAFYQIPDHWSPIVLPAGSEYATIYKDD